VKERKPIHDITTKFIWLISTARNILVVVFSAALAYFFELHGSQPFKLTGFIKPGLPEFKPPPFETQIDNTTYNFVDMSSALGSAIIVVPLLSILENIALAKVFGEYGSSAHLVGDQSRWLSRSVTWAKRPVKIVGVSF
jgi:sodium-independent sulfate anion transporter 11